MITQHRARRAGSTDDTHRANHLLAIAIDTYRHKPTLDNCVSDANELSRILTNNYDFHESHIETLYNEEASRRTILVRLREYAKKLGPQDNLVLFYAGHGELQEDLGYWIPHEASEFPDYVGVSDIRDQLELLGVHHLFVIADSCFSGSLFRSVRGTSQFQERHRSRYALTSGRLETVLDGPKGGHSPLMESLKYRLCASERSIGAVALSEHVVSDVGEHTKGFQTPRHGPLLLKGNDHGQLFFHRRVQSHPLDAFTRTYFSLGKRLLPPWDRRAMMDYFDDYDRRFSESAPEEQSRLRRVNTLAYLAKWGLTISQLKQSLSLSGQYRGTIDDEYCSEVSEAILEFQRDQGMRHQDGYFGELTYQQIVTNLIMTGLVPNPSTFASE